MTQGARQAGLALGGAVAARGALAAVGAGAGLGLYGLSELAEAQVLTGRPLLVVAGFAAAFCAGLLGMAGPIGLRRAVSGAALIAAVLSVLLALAATGFDAVTDMTDGPHVVLAALVLTLVPMPFWIARAAGAGFGDGLYRVLFAESWSIVVRMVASAAFAGLVWAVIWLSDAVLRMVGIDLIERVIGLAPSPWLISGAALGLSLAVVQEMSDTVSPYLAVRLLRLLLPVVAMVAAVFVLALPLRGVSGLFGAWSFALTLLAMAGLGVTLISTAVDQDDAVASQSAVLARSAQALGLMLPVLAGLGAWALWVRVAEYGWTPERVFGAQVAVLALGYGVLYAGAVLRGAGWRARIRRANIGMALALMGMAALALIPWLSAERVSAASLMARLEDGRLPVAQLEPGLLDRWGKPGAEARRVLDARAAGPGPEAEALRLALAGGSAGGPSAGEDPVDLRLALAAALPLQPVGAGATRDMYLGVLDSYELRSVLDNCNRPMPGGGMGCVMVVADLSPGLPGEEALLVEYLGQGFVQFTGFRNDVSQGPVTTGVIPANSQMPHGAAGEALIRSWAAAPPATMPVPMSQIVLPDGGGLILAP